MSNTQHVATDWLTLIQAEYREIPGLRLTKPQAQRLWGLEPNICNELLEALTASNFLKKTPNQSYMLAGHR